MDLRRLRRIHANLPAGVLSRRQKRPAPPRPDSDTAQVEALLAGLADKGRGSYKALWGVSLVFGGLALALCGFAAFAHVWAFAFLGLLLVCPGIPLTRWLRFHAERSHTLRQLTGYDDTRAIGPLIGALFSPNRNLRKAVRIALTRLLPYLQASDRVLLTPARHAQLYRCLTPHFARRSPEFVCALLKGLEQIGEAGALSGVQRLAALPARNPAQRRVRQAARDCLPYLETRIAQARLSHSLLRPVETLAEKEKTEEKKREEEKTADGRRKMADVEPDTHREAQTLLRGEP